MDRVIDAVQQPGNHGGARRPQRLHVFIQLLDIAAVEANLASFHVNSSLKNEQKLLVLGLIRLLTCTTESGHDS